MDITQTKKIVDLDYKAIALASYLIQSDLEGNAFKFRFSDILDFLNDVYADREDMLYALGQITLKANKTYVDAKDTQLQYLINQITKGVLNVFPSDTPVKNIDVYNAMSSGTYTYFGGLIVTTSDFSENLVRLNRSISGVWSKQLIPIGDNIISPIFTNDTIYI